MSVTEKLMSHGQFTVTLREDTPLSVRSKLDFFGHVMITRAHIANPGFLSDANMKANAIYSGVVEGQERRWRVLNGFGLVLWLGDKDGKGAVLETPVTFTAGTLSQWVNAIVPASLAAGTITNPGGTLTDTLQYMSPLQALDYVSAQLGTEYRVNPDFTVDAAVPATLFQSGKAIAQRRGGGPDLNVGGLQVVELGLKSDVEDYTVKALLVTKGEGPAVSTGSASNATGYKDGRGNTLVMTRIIDGASIDPANAAAAAQAQANRFASPRQAVTLSTDTYAINRRAKVGDSIYVHDVDLGLVDNTAQVFYDGQLLHPVLMRVYGSTWPIEQGMGVYFRDLNGTYVDLTDWVEWEAGATTLDVGAGARTTIDSAAGGSSTPAADRAAANNFTQKAYYQGNVSNGTATSKTAFITQNSILSFDQAYTMIVQVQLHFGFSGGTPQVNFDITDEAGNVITSGDTLDGNDVNYTGFGINRVAGYLTAKKQYAAGATCGFRVRYLLNTSNLYIAAIAVVTFAPGAI